MPTYYLDVPPDVESYKALIYTYGFVGESIAANTELYKPITELADPLASLYLSEETMNKDEGCFRLPFEFRAANTTYCFEFEL